MTEETLYVFKVMIGGSTGVGKTCLVQRYVDGRFHEDTYATIGVGFSLKNVRLDHTQLGSAITLQIWDMAGEAQFRTLLPNYIKGTQGLMIAFDSTKP